MSNTRKEERVEISTKSITDEESLTRTGAMSPKGLSCIVKTIKEEPEVGTESNPDYTDEIQILSQPSPSSIFREEDFVVISEFTSFENGSEKSCNDSSLEDDNNRKNIGKTDEVFSSETVNTKTKYVKEVTFSIINPYTGVESTNKARDAKNKLRSARRRLQKLSRKNPNDLTAWEMEQMENARAILSSNEIMEIARQVKVGSNNSESITSIPSNLGSLCRSGDCGVCLENPSKEKESITNGKVETKKEIIQRKRTASNDSTTPSTSKMVKGLSSLKNDYKEIAIVDQSEPEGKLDSRKWQLLEEKIQDALLERFASGKLDEIIFDGSDWDRGYKVVSCGNVKSREFLETTLSELNGIWTGAKLRVIPRDDIAKYQRRKVWIWIPKPYVSAEKVLKLLVAQNRGLGAEDWTILKEKPKKEHGQHFLLSINTTSLPYIERNQGMLRFSLSKIMLKILENDEFTDDGDDPSEPPSIQQ